MSPSFFDRPILNSPYDYPARYWELDENGQPTNRVIERRRPAQYVSPIPKPKKRRAEQAELDIADASGLSTEHQKYNPTPVINALRQSVDAWRALPNPNDWAVTPETARLLTHWRRGPVRGAALRDVHARPDRQRRLPRLQPGPPAQGSSRSGLIHVRRPSWKLSGDFDFCITYQVRCLTYVVRTVVTAPGG